MRQQAESFFEPVELPATWIILVYYLAYSSTLKMEVICSSETLIDFHLKTHLSIAEDRTLHARVCLELFRRILEVPSRSSNIDEQILILHV
jgi:hypothetical protein